MATETSAIGQAPTWAWSLEASANCPLDPAAMLEEGWAYLRQIFVVCFSGAQRISAEDMRALCGTTAALLYGSTQDCNLVQLNALDQLVQAQLRETMRRSAAGIDRLLPGPSLRAVVLARCAQLRAWSVMWERVFGRFIELDAPREFALAITARLQPSGMARACLGHTAYSCDAPVGGGGCGCHAFAHDCGAFSREARLYGNYDGSCNCGGPVFEEVVAAAGSVAAARRLLAGFEHEWREAAKELRRRLSRWRRHAPLVGRWRRFLILLHDEVHYRPANPGQKRCRDEFAALAAGTADTVSTLTLTLTLTLTRAPRRAAYTT